MRDTVRCPMSFPCSDTGISFRYAVIPRLDRGFSFQIRDCRVTPGNDTLGDIAGDDRLKGKSARTSLVPFSVSRIPLNPVFCFLIPQHSTIN